MLISSLGHGLTEHGLSEQRLRVKAARRWKWILRRGAIEPLAAAMSLVMLTGGVNLLFNAPEMTKTPLLFPLFFAYCLLVLGGCGFVGLSIRSTALLAFFSFFGLMVRTWMAALYFAVDPHDLSWISFACGSVVLFWIFSRVVCDAVQRQVARSRLSEAKGKSQPES